MKSLTEDIHSPPSQDALLDELAELCLASTRADARVARLLYTLRAHGLRPGQIVQEMHRRHAHGFSSSWVVRLVRIYEWWCVRHSYDAEEVFRYSKNKLYAMALHHVADWDFLLTYGDLPDRQFMAILRKETNTEPEAYLLSVPAPVKAALVAISERLSRLTHSQVGIIPALELAVEVLHNAPDEMLLTLWRAAHGEISPQEAVRYASAQAN